MTPRQLTLALAAALLVPAPCAAQRAPLGRLVPFGSERELAEYLRRATAPRPVPPPPPALPSAPAANACDTAAAPAGAAVVRGRVTNASTGAALGGAQVQVGALARGAACADGTFRIVIRADSVKKPRAATVLARHIGYSVGRKDVTLSAGESVEAALALEAAATQLSEVVLSAASEASASPARRSPVLKDAGASITNVQHAGVDEGGIVKVHGDHLVVLRRGRLFTVRVGGGSLRPVAAVNAYGPDIDGSGAWYDEMLVSGDRVVVIGYSYTRSGSEIGVFSIDEDGRLRHRDTYHLRSNDYYSSRDYASRLVDGRLVLYTPLYLRATRDPLDVLPAMRRWRRGAEGSEWRRTFSPRRVYRPEGALESEATALHTITRCDVEAPEMRCESTVVLGPWGRVSYVSPSAAYVWTTAGRRSDEGTPSTLYRLPLDGGEPAALGVEGVPVDQFSFLESEDAHLNVLVRDDGYGSGMWGAERSSRVAGATALLRVPLASFSDRIRQAPRSRYRLLPSPAADGRHGAFHNRFVGGHLLYGVGNGWGPQATQAADLFVVRWDRADDEVARIDLAHGVDRIEEMGDRAVVIGADGRDLHFTGVRLGTRPRVAQRFRLPDASQGETRSHGFFYSPDGRGGGMLGLPVARAGRPGWRSLREGSASVLFLRDDGRRFDELGALDAGAAPANDYCVASCADWYGNARPLFLRGRILALLGYELVEGRVRGGRIVEDRRVSFAPRSPMRVRPTN